MSKEQELIGRLLMYKNDDSKYSPEDILTIEDVWLLVDYVLKLEQENQQLKNKLNNIKKAINGHIDGFITINNFGSCDGVLEVLFDLKEVSEEVCDE